MQLNSGRGDPVPKLRLPHGARSHRRLAAGSALSLRALAGLDHGQEPGRACHQSAYRGLIPTVLTYLQFSGGMDATARVHRGAWCGR